MTLPTDFDEIPTDEVIVSFFKELSHTGEIKSITDVVVDHMHQPWRNFATIINRSLSGKTIGLDKLRLSIAQILWGMYYKMDVDYVEPLWEDFTYQIDNRGHKKQEKIISYYRARLPESMTSPEMRETKAYKTYIGYATGVTPPKKERKFKKPTSPKVMTIPASPKEPTKKSKSVKRPAKKSTNAPTTGVVIKDTPGVFVLKKITPAKADRGKGIDGSSEGADFKSEVPDKSKAKSSDTNEGTCVKSGVPDVSNVDSFESDNESWGDSDDDNESDDNDNKGTENDDDSGNDAQDSERTDSNEEENPNLNLYVDKEEETQEEEYIHTTNYSVPTDEETDDENIEFDDEEYDDLYKDVNVRSKVAEHEEVGKGDVEMTNVARESGSQEKSYEQVVEDAHVTLTTSQKTKGSKKSSFVSSDFASKFPILDNVPPVVDEVVSTMNVKVRQE
ncbi:hypothetical protein Tco_1398664 [Tanacetum coccineum]